MAPQVTSMFLVFALISRLTVLMPQLYLLFRQPKFWEKSVSANQTTRYNIGQMQHIISS